MHDDYVLLMDYALRIISKKRYTISEMRKKLGGFLKRETDCSETVQNVLERLIELNYLNDEEYAKHYVADRARFRPRGRRLIERELMLKGIKKDDLLKAFVKEENGEGYDEILCAEDLIRRKHRAWENFDLKKKREKAFRFLQSKGFGRDTIYKALRSCYNQITE